MNNDFSGASDLSVVGTFGDSEAVFITVKVTLVD